MATNVTSSTPLTEDYHVSESNGETDSILMIVIRPSICGLGFVTNILSLLVFLQPSMRNLSCSVYLATKACSDFTFLSTTFIVWLTSVDIGLLNTVGLCQLVVFANYLTAFVSIWLVVALTIENLLCMVKPWFVQRSCNARSARILTTAIVVLGIGFYHFALWNNGIRPHTRLVEKIVDVNYVDSESDSYSSTPDQMGNSENLRPLTESILIQKILNATSVPQPASLNELENIKVIRKSTIVISNQSSQTDIVDTFVTPVGMDFYTQASTQPSTSAGGLDNYVPELTNPTNTTFVMEIGQSACLPLEEFSHFAVALTYVDSLMTLLVPLIILSVTNASIIVLALRASRVERRRDMVKYSETSGYHQPSTTYTSTSCATLDNHNVDTNDNNHHHQQQSQQQHNANNASNTNTNHASGEKRQKNSSASRNGSIAPNSSRRSTRASLETQASRFLFSVSMTLLVFHMPSHLVRLKWVLQIASPLDIVLFRWFETLYISHYAIGFFVYVSFGKNFRKVFFSLLGRS